MKIRIKKPEFGNQLVPADFESQENINKLKQDIIYTVNPVKCRNPKFHSKFFALINTGFKNTKSKINDVEFYREVMLIKAGICNVIIDKKTTYVFAKSIAFDKMDQFEFEKVYTAVFNQIIIDTEADEELFKKELSRFMSN